jgi:hypothetical protein
LLAVCWGNVFSACASNLPAGDGPKDNKTAQPEPTATLTLAEYKEESERTGAYQGLDSILAGFTLDAYNCVYISERAVVWVIQSEAPEKV